MIIDYRQGVVNRVWTPTCASLLSREPWPIPGWDVVEVADASDAGGSGNVAAPADATEVKELSPD
ncbi:hypothetical protein [Streptomyces sp. NPDC057438]|uniref:hypothetical protein n=1 Tax=Streptomyces sp. NPDC057438 TaxID=3346133 RepID=UPI003675534B